MPCAVYDGFPQRGLGKRQPVGRVGLQQLAGKGVLRRGRHGVDVALLHRLPVAQHNDLAAQRLRHLHIVRDGKQAATRLQHALE